MSTYPHFPPVQSKDNRDFEMTVYHFGIRLPKPEDLKPMKDLGSMLFQNLQLREAQDEVDHPHFGEAPPPFPSSL